MLRVKFYFLIVALSILFLARPESGVGRIVDTAPIAPGSIVHLRGSSFAFRAEMATDGSQSTVLVGGYDS